MSSFVFRKDPEEQQTLERYLPHEEDNRTLRAIASFWNKAPLQPLMIGAVLSATGFATTKLGVGIESFLRSSYIDLAFNDIVLAGRIFTISGMVLFCKGVQNLANWQHRNR